jgi:type I restriction enzyme S subunit
VSDINNSWSLPSSWIWTTIGEVADVIGGGTPATSDRNNFGGCIPWITPADMSNHKGKLISHGARSLTDQGMEGSGARILPKGTVLFSSRAPIGYVAIASQPLTTNQGFKSFVPANGIISEYLYYWLTSAKPLAEELASGTTFLELSGAKAALIPIPLAPTNEQTQIVEKLEELLTDLDAGIAELKAAQKKLAQYRQSLLKSAVEGELTAEWRTNNKPKETGAHLLELILKERRARWEEKQLAKFKEQGKTPPKGWQDKYPEPVQPDTPNLPKLPEGWVWMTIDQLSIVVRGASPRPAGDPKYFGGNIPWITVGSITAEDTIYLEKVSQFVTEAGMQASRYIEPDTLLLTNSGATLGVPKILRIGGCINDGSVALLDVEDPIKHYLYWFLTTQTKSLRALNQGAAQPNLNTDIVRHIVVPICPVEEMKVINDLILSGIENAKQQEIALIQSLKRSEAQRKNILKSAFSGHLVPQDFNGEPASVLLERIREERKKQSTQPKQRKAKVTKEISIVTRKLIDVLTEADDWLPAQEAFLRCGIADSATTEQIEDLYSELRRLDKENHVIVEPVVDAHGTKQYDRLRLAVKG